MTPGSCFIILLSFINAGLGANSSANPYAQWENGPTQTGDFSPIAVWLQKPGQPQEIQAGRDAKRQDNGDIHPPASAWRK